MIDIKCSHFQYFTNHVKCKFYQCNSAIYLTNCKINNFISSCCLSVELLAFLVELTEAQIVRLQRLVGGFLYAFCRVRTSEQYIRIG
jgi:hypothetical protein